MGSIPAGGANLKSRGALKLSGFSVFLFYRQCSKMFAHFSLAEHHPLMKLIVINLYCHILNMYFDEILYLVKNNVKLYVR